MAGSAHGRRGHVTPHVGGEDEAQGERRAQGHAAQRDPGGRVRGGRPALRAAAVHPRGYDPAELSPCDMRGVFVTASVLPAGPRKHPQNPGSGSAVLVWLARHEKRTRL